MNTVIMALVCLSMGSGSHQAKPFSFSGEYVEGCSCMGVCQCELTGVEMGCQGVGVFHAAHASYGGTDISGFKAGYAVEPGKWVIIYIDAPAGKADTVTAFMKSALAPLGPVESIKAAKIDFTDNGGNCKAAINDGSILDFSSEPVIGGNGKTPLTYNNIHDALHPTIMQGKTLACTFNDGDHSFSLKGTNAFFNDHIRSNGSF